MHCLSIRTGAPFQSFLGGMARTGVVVSRHGPQLANSVFLPPGDIRLSAVSLWVMSREMRAALLDTMSKREDNDVPTTMLTFGLWCFYMPVASQSMLMAKGLLQSSSIKYGQTRPVVMIMVLQCRIHYCKLDQHCQMVCLPHISCNELHASNSFRIARLAFGV